MEMVSEKCVVDEELDGGWEIGFVDEELDEDDWWTFVMEQGKINASITWAKEKEGFSNYVNPLLKLKGKRLSGSLS